MIAERLDQGNNVYQPTYCVHFTSKFNNKDFWKQRSQANQNRKIKINWTLLKFKTDEFNADAMNVFQK